jgi:hypothetical protein
VIDAPEAAVAVAASEIVAGAWNVAPFVGAVSETVGGSTTVMETGFEVFVLPPLSATFAVSEYVPGAGGTHDTEYGDVVSGWPMGFVPP